MCACLFAAFLVGAEKDKQGLVRDVVGHSFFVIANEELWIKLHYSDGTRTH